jgi:uncharacterized protein (DUF58 family)
MFGTATLTLLILLLVLSILVRQTPLFLLSLALLLAATLSRLWERYGLVGVEYSRRFSKRQARFGETIELELEIVNRKLLPLAWLEIEDEISPNLPLARGKVNPPWKNGRAILANLVALRPYERVRRHYPLPCTVRGEHVFGPTRLRTGDLFGLVTRETERDETESIVVYPRVVPLTALGLPAFQPLGDRRSQSWLFEDPSRIVGVRELRPGDSMRRIHWAASARTQQLQVKVFEPTTSHKLVIFFNLNTTLSDWWNPECDPDVLELGITTAASIASWAFDERYQVGLATNGMHRYGSRRVVLDPSGDPMHLPRLLEALGRLQLNAIRPFEQTLVEESRHLLFGTTAVAITAELSASVAAELLRMRRRGHAVTVILTGRDPKITRLDGIAIRLAGPPEAWREALSLALKPI